MQENQRKSSTPRYDEQYKAINEEAHKRGAIAISAPALVWHLGVFASFDKSESSSQSDAIAEQAGLKIADLSEDEPSKEKTPSQKLEQAAIDFSEAVVDSLPVASAAKHAEKIKCSLPNTLASSGHLIVHFSLDGVLIKMIVTPHSDHFTVMTVIDLSKPASSADKYDTVDLIELQTQEGKLEEQLTRHFRLYREFASDPENSDSEGADKAREFLQNEIWDIVSARFFEATGLFENQDSSILSQNRLCAFGDFRGVMLDARDAGDPFGKSGKNNDPKRFDGAGECFSEEDQANALNLLLPMMTIGDQQYQFKELVACTIFRNRAVYLSPLGATPLEQQLDRMIAPRPLYFALAVCENNRWQIGRMIHRLTSLGTLRLLALLDFEKIQKASRDIRRVGGCLSNLILVGDKKIRISESDVEEDEMTLKTIRSEIDKIGDDVTGGLSYRVYRSTFRSEQFKDQLQDLEVGRIEGWQPYDEFVKRRLYPAFDFISRVGDRHSALEKSYEAQLFSLNSEMQSASGRHLVKIQKDVLHSHKFQHIIESIALGYYGGLVVYYILKPYIGNEIIGLLNHIAYIGPNIGPNECTAVTGDCYYDKYFQSLCMLIFALWGGIRFYQNRKAHDEKIEEIEALEKQSGSMKADGKTGDTIGDNDAGKTS